MSDLYGELPKLSQENTSLQKVCSLLSIVFNVTHSDCFSLYMRNGNVIEWVKDQGTSVVKPARKFICPVLGIL